MRLGPKFTKKLLAGERPALTEEPELEPGQVIDLHSYARYELRPHQFRITVGRLDKAGMWSYVLSDAIPRYLGKGSGYTSRPDQAMKARTEEFEPESVDEQVQRELTVRAHERAAERQSLTDAEELRRKQERAIRNRLRECLRGLSPTGQQALLAYMMRGIEHAQDFEKAA